MEQLGNDVKSYIKENPWTCGLIILSSLWFFIVFLAIIDKSDE